MIRRNRVRYIASLLVLATASFTAMCPAAEPAATPKPQFPKIEKYGSVFPLPDAGERPRPGGKVVFDTTAAGFEGKPNRGLESAARLVNIFELETLGQERPQIAVILHGQSTSAALNDAAHAKAAAGASNPNRELVDKLRANGVEVWVCGQSVIRGGHALDDVMPGIRIAYSAMIFNMNRQTDGWSTLGVY